MSFAQLRVHDAGEHLEHRGLAQQRDSLAQKDQTELFVDSAGRSPSPATDCRSR